MTIKVKKGFIAELLSDLDIKFNNCGISQQSYEYLRDGRHVRESVINRLEEKCDILRNFDFPIYGIKLPNFDNAKVINFIDESIAKSQLETLMFNIKHHSKNNEIIRPDHIDLYMHKLGFNTYQKIKKINFDSTLWATDIPKHALDENYVLEPPEYITTRNKTSSEIIEWSELKNVDHDLLEPITLTELLKKFNEEFLKEDVEDYAQEASNDLFSAINKKLEQPDYGDQMEYILAYLEYNDFEFQYNIRKFIDDEVLQSGKNLGDMLVAEKFETQAMEKSAKENWVKQQKEASFDEFKNFIGFDQMAFEDSILINNEINDKNPLKQSDGLEYIPSNPYGAMCKRYLREVKTNGLMYGCFTMAKISNQLQIALVKKESVNFAMLDDALLKNQIKTKLTSVKDETVRGTNHEYIDNNQIHKAKFRWNPDPVILYIDGRYIPQPVPIVSENDFSYFISRGWVSPENKNLINGDIMTIKKELIILLKNKDFFEIYTEWVSFKEIEYRVQSIKMQSTKKSNIFYEGCRENNFALFDSYLAALAKSYRFYYNKIKPEAFRELILEEITEYNKIFEIAENKNIQ